MWTGLPANPPGYVSFAQIRKGFVRWLEAGARQERTTIAGDGRGAHSTRWLLAVLEHSDEPLSEREKNVFTEWLRTVDTLTWILVENLPDTTRLTFRTVARYIRLERSAGRWSIGRVSGVQRTPEGKGVGLALRS